MDGPDHLMAPHGALQSLRFFFENQKTLGAKNIRCTHTYMYCTVVTFVHRSFSTATTLLQVYHTLC